MFGGRLEAERHHTYNRKTTRGMGRSEHTRELPRRTVGLVVAWLDGSTAEAFS
jgi:hypothetical protein